MTDDAARAAPALDVERLARVLEDLDFGPFWDEYPVIEDGVRVATEAYPNHRRMARDIAREYALLSNPENQPPGEQP